MADGTGSKEQKDTPSLATHTPDPQRNYPQRHCPHPHTHLNQQLERVAVPMRRRALQGRNPSQQLCKPSGVTQLQLLVRVQLMALDGC